mmetsp:Transcript_22713/g.48211  ORF Transcript_22713/g.48211 Transcript_22713/m.48211 type:complete len:248 (+) Transcript_22713:2003-2746(+)
MTLATSSRGTVLGESSPPYVTRSSSTPTISSRWLPGSLIKPPGCTMVYFRLELLPDFSMRYFSDLRFHMRMFPPVSLPVSLSIFLPSEFSGFDGSVPPMLEHTTTCRIDDIAASSMASIWFFWPIQSTISGSPPSGNPKTGRLSFISPVGRGVPEVQMHKASTVFQSRAPFKAVSSATSQTTNFDSSSTGIDGSSSKASLLVWVRTMPTTSKSSSLRSWRNKDLPVCPPAPLTTIFLATAADRASAE